ncbi:MAG: murein peptide amidase [Actinomycetota bacterium]|nr:murein peptide amidase [Actinomycetota bacterium]
MKGMPRTRARRLVLTSLAVAGLVLPGAPVVASAHGPDGPTTQRLSMGTSVRGRPIPVLHRAFPPAEAARVRVVVIGSIHGDERAGLRVIRDLKQRNLPANVDLWLVRTVNPDGVVADRRTNAHRVDLNRNFPYRWRSVDKGSATYSGPRALSEPESRALKAFITTVQPQLVVTFHQPLYGVGANDKGMPVVRALAKGMRLPVKTFACTGVCHGSFTSWVNNRTPATAVTVELGPSVSDALVHRAAATILTVGSRG